MNPFRVLLWIDVALAAVGAAMCLAAPRAFAAGYLTTPLAHPGEEIVRWLGLMFVVYAAVMGRGLVAGDRAYWRVILPAIVLGDAMHIGASLWRTTLPDFHASSTAIADLVVVCSYLPLRFWLARHPERLDRAPAA